LLRLKFSIMAYFGRPPSGVEIDSHYAMFTMIIEDGMKTNTRPIDIMMSVDAELKNLYGKNYKMASEVAKKLNNDYGRIYYPLKFRT